MSKRNIRGKSGKQLYLNQLFLGGMKYTSSEMTEGVAKVICNYDISPTGDSAMPRTSFTSKELNNNIGKYIYPFKFNQSINEQHYIEFVNTVSEEDYVNDTTSSISTDISNAPLRFYSRPISGDNNITNPNVTLTPETEGDIDPEIAEAKMQELIEHGFKPIHIYNNVDENYIDSDDEEVPIGSWFTFKDSSSVLRIRTGANSSENFTPYLTNLSVPDRSTFVVKDGDTFKTMPGFNEEIRLLGIDTPETNVGPVMNWGPMATNILKYITNTYLMDSSVPIFFRDYGLDNDEYNRRVLEIYFIYQGTRYSLSEIMVRCGVAKTAYMYDDYLIQNTLYEAESDADENNLGLHSNEVDPYLKTKKNSLTISPGCRFEFVKTYDTKAINSVLSNVNDVVQYQYIDYLDSVAVLGRVIEASNQIIYKGLMYIKPDISDSGFNFKIELPPNNFEGEEPDIIAAQETGYNLLNSTLINLEDSNDEYLVAGIKGLVVTDPSESKVIMRATKGQQVKLNAVMNYGYVTQQTDPAILGYRITLKAIKHFATENYEEVFYPDTGEDKKEIVTEAEESIHTIELSKSGSALLNFSIKNKTDVLTRVDIQFKTFEAILYYGETTEYVDITPLTGINTNTRYTLDINKIASDFENVEKYTLINLGLGSNNGLLELSISKFNFTSVKYTPKWAKDESNETRFPIKTLVSLDLEFKDSTTIDLDYTTHVMAKWEKANYGADLEKEDGWSIISDKETYEVIDNKLTLKENLVEDTNWIVDTNSNQSLRFTVYFLKKVSILNGNQQIGMHSKTYDITLAMPLFKIGVVAEFLDQEDILNNVNIKDATRLGVFNRQLYLYGPHTKSNFIQFSMFEQEWYLPFPYYNIEIPEPIVYVYPYLNSLVVFGKNNIYMLTGGVGVLDLSLHKIYENLSITASDINLVNTVGTSLMFFNNNIGYLIVPNTYSDDPTNIKIYKLTDNISNALLNPEELIRDITGKLGIGEFSDRIFASYSTYIDSNTLNIAVNYTLSKGNKTSKCCIIYRYNQTYKYWNIYYCNLFDSLYNAYIAEPQLGAQFITSLNDKQQLTFLNPTYLDNIDNLYKLDGTNESQFIETFLDTGYLSVDTMNDKRFKDIILELDNIKRNKSSEMYMLCNFFIDGTPILISDINAISIESISENNIDPYMSLKDEEFSTNLHHISSLDRDSNNPFIFDSTYGVAFKIDDTMYTNIGRTHVRIPVFGKGRLPSFKLKIITPNNYEFINYSLIYKEKNINRRR